MNAKEYLSQLRHIDQRINAKLVQVTRLREMATSATSPLSDMPRSDSPDLQPLESIIVKLVDMQDEINAEIDQLVDLKREAMEIIQAVRRPEYRALIEMRYLGFMTWERIAEVNGYDTRTAYRDHRHALRAVDSVLRERESQ